FARGLSHVAARASSIGQARVPLAGADPGTAGDAGLGHLRSWDSPLRVFDGAPSVHAHRSRTGPRAPLARDAGASARLAEAAERHCSAVSVQGPSESLRERP